MTCGFYAQHYYLHVYNIMQCIVYTDNDVSHERGKSKSSL